MRRVVRGVSPAVLVVVTAGVLNTNLASASAAPGVAVAVDACVPVDRPALEQIVAIELGTSMRLDAEGDRRAALTRVTIACASEGITIRVDDGVTQKSLARTVDLATVAPDARTRLLALATAELVVASWIELTLDAPPVPAIGPRPTRAATTEAADVVRRRSAVAVRHRVILTTSAAASAWTTTPGPVMAAGLGVGVLHLATDIVGWQASVQFERGLARVAVEPGDVEMTTALQGDLALVVHGSAGRFKVSAGLGGFASLAFLRGVAAPGAGIEGRDARIPIAGPTCVARLAFRLDDRLAIALRVLGAVLALPAHLTADGHTVFRAEGARVGADLGLALAL